MIESKQKSPSKYIVNEEIKSSSTTNPITNVNQGLSMPTEQSIKQKIESEIPEVHNIIVTDISAGCGQSFDVVVVSGSFEGKNKLQRSRLVNKALKEEIAQIHAFSCKCYTEKEWSKLVV